MTYAQQLERLIDAVQDLSLARDLDGIAAIVRHVARVLTGADGATFVLREGEQCYYKDEEAIGPLWKGQRFPLGACVSGWVIEHRQAVVIPDVYQDARVPHDAYRPTFVRSMVMVPVREPIAAIGIYWAEPHTPAADDVALLQALANAVSVAMENVQVYQELERRVQERTGQLTQRNEQLHAEVMERRRVEGEVRRLSVTDELTGLRNRRGFFAVAERRLETARRKGRPGALLYLDLDGLKRCNDTQGHAAGDALLVAMAQVLKTVFRKADVLARFGGDEFVVLVSDVQANLDSLPDRLRAAASAAGLAFSLGVVPLSANGNLDQLLALADQAMYVDKLARSAGVRIETESDTTGAMLPPSRANGHFAVE